MKGIAEAGFVLTMEELVFLASLIGSKELYGLEYDFDPMGEKEIAVKWKGVRKQLEDKKYIEVELNNEVTIDKELYEVLNSVCQPRLLIKYVLKDEEISHSRNFYFSEKICIELDEDRLMKKTYILTPMVSLEKVLQNLDECFFTSKNYGEEKLDFEVPLSDFEKLNAIDGSFSEVDKTDLLVGSGLSNELAVDLLKAINEKTFFISVAIFEIENNTIEKLKTYFVVGGKDFLWSIRIPSNRCKKQDVSFKICRMESISDEIIQFVANLRGVKEMFRNE